MAPRHGETLGEGFLWQAMAYTTPFSLTASPVLVVPVGTGEDGLPVCVQIVAPSWADEKLSPSPARSRKTTAKHRP